MTAERPANGVSTIRFGIIGVGMMAIEHIGNVAAIPDAEVVALSDPHRPSLDEAMASLVPRGLLAPQTALFADHRRMLEYEAVDAVIVASPNFTHVDIVADVIGAGHHVLIEKPLCTTVADCQKVVAEADGARQVIQVGLEYRYMPPVARLLQELRTGVIGTTRMVGIREHRFPFLAKVGDWNRFSVNTGGTLVEKCCHFFDLMNVILDERPNRVMASGAQDVNHLEEYYDGQRSDILDNAFVIVDYPSGARASLDLCMFAEATHNQEEISVVGDRGKLEALVPEGVLRTGRRGEHTIGSVDHELVTDDHIAFMGTHHGSSYVEVIEFLDAIRSGGPAPVTLDDGLWSVAMGVAAHRSIDEGRMVDLSEVME